MLNAPSFNPQSPTKTNNMIIAYLGRNVKEYRKHIHIKGKEYQRGL